jgi:hypothetical protein
LKSLWQWRRAKTLKSKSTNCKARANLLKKIRVIEESSFQLYSLQHSELLISQLLSRTVENISDYSSERVENGTYGRALSFIHTNHINFRTSLNFNCFVNNFLHWWEYHLPFAKILRVWTRLCRTRVMTISQDTHHSNAEWGDHCYANCSLKRQDRFNKGNAIVKNMVLQGKFRVKRKNVLERKLRMKRKDYSRTERWVSNPCI